MPKYNEVFSQFFSRYPAAERRDYNHTNGMSSVVAVGLVRGHVDGAFIGVYKENGVHRSEEHFPLDVIEENFGRVSVGNAEMLSRLTELAVAKAQAPILP
ncbi:hypothetical protein [Pseudomonas viridiflava]|uniref:hypothetical protein n=1 Tax=Pseudomonas viridiflava TaxID=33069 RepID=UPI000F027C68|nr:hypothetical protein [Pseudomonas viridiflava]